MKINQIRLDKWPLYNIFKYILCKFLEIFVGSGQVYEIESILSKSKKFILQVYEIEYLSGLAKYMKLNIYGPRQVHEFEFYCTTSITASKSVSILFRVLKLVFTY